MTASSALADRLGLPSGARAVILNADDFGMCHAANAAISDSWRVTGSTRRR